MIDMNEAKLTTLEQLRQLLAGTAAVGFKPGPDDTRFTPIADVLRRFQDTGLKRAEPGMVLRYLERTTGYLPHQRRGLRNPLGTDRYLRKDQRDIPVAGHRATPGWLPVSAPGFSCRQRLGVHQLPRSPLDRSPLASSRLIPQLELAPLIMASTAASCPGAIAPASRASFSSTHRPSFSSSSFAPGQIA